MELRPYQQAAREAIEREWEGGRARTLLVLPTGCGKTVSSAPWPKTSWTRAAAS